jgi:hypothetical protein
MPSKTLRQHIAMAIAAHRPKASKDKIPQAVAEEYIEADKREGKFKGKEKK